MIFSTNVIYITKNTKMDHFMPWVNRLCMISYAKTLTLIFSETFYPISTLPEHLHSTSLSHAKTTWKHTKQKETLSFPLYRSLPVSRSPTPPYTPLRWESQPHPLILVILYFGAYEACVLLGCSLLCLVCFNLTKLPVFHFIWLYWLFVDTYLCDIVYIYIYIYI